MTGNMGLRLYQRRLHDLISVVLGQGLMDQEKGESQRFMGNLLMAECVLRLRYRNILRCFCESGEC